MKFLRQIWINLKWLFNHPPTGVTNLMESAACDYCGDESGLWHTGHYTICVSCQKKVYDAVLKSK